MGVNYFKLIHKVTQKKWIWYTIILDQQDHIHIDFQRLDIIMHQFVLAWLIK